MTVRLPGSTMRPVPKHFLDLTQLKALDRPQDHLPFDVSGPLAATLARSYPPL
jgi:hypothetical protein